MDIYSFDAETLATPTAAPGAIWAHSFVVLPSGADVSGWTGVTSAEATPEIKQAVAAELSAKVPNDADRDDEMRAVLAWLHIPTSEDVNVERRRRLDEGKGFTVSWQSEPIHITGRAEDEPVLLALLMRAQGYKAAGVTAPVLSYRDGQNVSHTLTPDQMIEMVMAGMNWFEAVMKASWTMKDAGIPSDYTADAHWPN